MSGLTPQGHWPLEGVGEAQRSLEVGVISGNKSVAAHRISAGMRRRCKLALKVGGLASILLSVGGSSRAVASANVAAA